LDASWECNPFPTLVESGASRVFWFQLDEGLYAPSGFGLLGPDLAPRRANAAPRNLTSQYIQSCTSRVCGGWRKGRRTRDDAAIPIISNSRRTA